MKKFLVLYMAPASVMQEWMKLPEAERKVAEDKMKGEWQVWMQEHAAMIKETAGAGKAMRITKEGAMDAANEIMLYSIVEAESAEAAAKIFEGHPHLGIPQASIEIMPANPMGM